MNTQNIYNNNNKDININSNTKVKICGLTSPAEARYLNENHVDFAGMVLFFPKSKRNISIEQAKEIMAALDASIKRVAVVVSPSIEQVRQIEAAGFDYVQIHGEIPETEAEAAKAIPILKAFNVSDMDSYEKYHNDSRIAGYVFDAIEPGSGKTFDWKLVDNIPRDEKLLLLAGGLNPDNVRMAIEAVHPDGVDVSSGVEMITERRVRIRKRYMILLRQLNHKKSTYISFNMMYVDFFIKLCNYYFSLPILKNKFALMSTGLSAIYTIVAAITDITALTPVVVTLHAILSCAIGFPRISIS